MRRYIFQIIFLFLVFTLFLPGADEEKFAEKFLRDLNESGNRENALKWLSALKEPRAIPYLVETLYNEKNYRKVESTVINLGQIGHPDAIVPLIEFLLTNKDHYYDDECFYSLNRIDPLWMKREDVRAYIPRFFDELKIMVGTGSNENNSYSFQRKQASLLKFIYLTAPKQAIPLSLELIEYPRDLNYQIPGMILNNLVDNNVREACEPIFRQIFNPHVDQLPLPELVNALDKLQPGWKETKAFETNLNAQLKKIKGENTVSDICNAIKIVKAVKPAALIPLAEKIISNPEENKELKVRVLNFFEEISPEDHFDLFISGLKNSDIEYRFACIEGLMKTRDVRAIPHLIGLLDDPNTNIRRRTIWVLESFKSREIIRPLVDITDNSENEGMIVRIMEALSSIEPGPPIQEMIGIWEKWKKKLSIYDRGDILGCFFKLNDPKMMDYLIQFYPSAPSNEKLWLLRFFVQKKDTRLMPFFQETLKSSDIRMRAYAEAGIFKLSSD